MIDTLPNQYSRSTVKYPTVSTLRTEEAMVPTVYAASTEETDENLESEETVKEEILSLENEVAALKLIIIIFVPKALKVCLQEYKKQKPHIAKDLIVGEPFEI